MRIGISVFGSAAGGTKGAGIIVYSKNLIKNLAIIDKTNKYYVFLSKDNEKDFDGICQDNIYFRIIPIRETGFTRILFEQFILPILTIVYRIDVMHYVLTRIPFVYFSKSVITVHDLMHRFYKENIQGYMSYFKCLYFDLNFRRALRRAKKIIAVSQYTAGKIQQYFHALKEINVIYEGVDPIFSAKFSADSMQKSEVENDKYILTVKSDFPHKNLKSVLESFILAKRNYNISHKLVIAGCRNIISNEYLQIIEKYDMRKYVVFMRNISDKELASIYKKASLFVFLSLNEGFGLPVLEAMTAGVPVICSNRASLPELVGDAAITVDPFDVNKISNEINNCLNNEILRKQMISSGLQRAIKFSWGKTALETLDVYNSIAI